jgi:hypothetical protein
MSVRAGLNQTALDHVAEAVKDVNLSGHGIVWLIIQGDKVVGTVKGYWRYGKGVERDIQNFLADRTSWRTSALVVEIPTGVVRQVEVEVTSLMQVKEVSNA